MPCSFYNKKLRDNKLSNCDERSIALYNNYKPSGTSNPQFSSQEEYIAYKTGEELKKHLDNMKSNC